jgi:hypothetical protein
MEMPSFLLIAVNCAGNFIVVVDQNTFVFFHIFLASFNSFGKKQPGAEFAVSFDAAPQQAFFSLKAA